MKTESIWKLRLLSVISCTTIHGSMTSDEVTEEDAVREPPFFLPLSSISIPSPFSLQTSFSCNLFTSASFCSSLSFKAASSSCNRHRITQWQFPHASETFPKFFPVKCSGEVLSWWKWLRAPWHLHWLRVHRPNCLWTSQQTTETVRGQRQGAYDPKVSVSTCKRKEILHLNLKKKE